MARAKKSKSKVTELEEQSDPRAALDAARFLSACQEMLGWLEADLLERARSSPAVMRALEARYEAEKSAQRTAETFSGWTELLATQVAAAWVLSCVFVRTLEDRGLLKQARLAGPGAEDSQRQFFQLAPSLTERAYLLTVFRELAHHPAAAPLFDTDHSPVWKLSPSPEAAKRLLSLFRMPNATMPGFRFGQSSTRFLGDLYQGLSEEVRKRYALLQTPDFIESFILDRTLEPAIARFGIDDTTLIDPTCGSGHFLLGAFERLFEHRLRAEPGIDVRVAAVKALDCVYGVDINPYAVAIARFRLTLSFLEKAGYAKLADAPAIPLHLVVADTLRINAQHPQTELWQQEGASSEGWLGEVFTLEDERAAKDVLFRQYAAVVGNPPYITPKDRAQRTTYAEMYETCFMNYALSVPFCERLFQLARSRGFVGQITSNSFMKREFGTKLIEGFLPSTNLELIVNTSGAYIPGHGTPTVLLFGTREPPKGTEVSTVLAKKGEPSIPSDPSKGLVWNSIKNHFGEIAFENEFIKTETLSRDELGKHPWCIGEGRQLKKFLEERCESRLKDVVDDIGYSIILGEEEVFLRPANRAGWAHLPRIAITIGEEVRDWSLSASDEILRPFNAETLEVDAESPLRQELWPWRSVLKNRVVSGSTTIEEAKKQWFDVRRLSRDKHKTPRSIVFAFVATHNHFVFDRGGRVFGQSAPIIKLPTDASDEMHLALAAYLNSSTACFWMKQIFYPKGGDSMGDGGRLSRASEEDRYEFASTGLLDLPIPPGMSALASYGKELRDFAVAREELVGTTIERLIAGDAGAVDRGQHESESIFRRMVATQEALDWHVYRLAGLTSAEPVKRAEIDPLERAFLTGAAEVLSPFDDFAFLESPMHKRPWGGRSASFTTRASAFASRALSGLNDRLLDRTEEVLRQSATPLSMRGIDDGIRGSDSNAPNFAAVPRIENQAAKESVLRASMPFLAALRFDEAGLAKWSEWQRVWGLQRAEDAGRPLDVPPKYNQGDFLEPAFWALRGKLDVPKDRFISYPFCESDNDDEPVLGWAGWDYLQRAKALWSLYVQRRDGEGWTADRLAPMLAGLLELIPWVKQWHNEPSEEYGGLRMGDNFADVLEGECRRHGLTHDDLRAWRPPTKSRGGKVSSKVATRVQREAVEDKHAAHMHGQLEAREQGLVSDKHPAKPRARRKGAARSSPSDETGWVARLEVQQAGFLRERGARFHDRGDRSYVMTVEDNVLALSAATRSDLSGGSGNELGTEERPGKFLAPWSSSALAVNVFEHWRHLDAKPIVHALGASGSFPIMHFEARLPTGLRGGAANLDVVLEDTAGRRIAIESKFLEPYRGNSNGSEDPAFSPAYFAEPRPWLGIAGLRDLAKAIVDGSTRFTRLDAPQLVKHILALRHAGKPFELIHLWYRPNGNLAEVKVLEQEIAAFRAVTERDDVRFRSMTYQDLFARLCAEAPAEVDYLAYLRNRYFTTSTTPENQ